MYVTPIPITACAMHGTALSTVLNYYYPEFDFKRLRQYRTKTALRALYGIAFICL